MKIVITGGHMTGSAGMKAVVESHAERIAQTVLAIHLEHVARDFEVVDGTPDLRDEVEARRPGFLQQPRQPARPCNRRTPDSHFPGR